MKPAAVLIEGPADFNDRIDELFLPHRPPLAIYSYLCLPSGQRRGAYYPLCEHSPEWQALLASASWSDGAFHRSTLGRHRRCEG